MNREFFKISINEDLENMIKVSKEYFSKDEILILLRLLDRYRRGHEYSSVINLINKLDLLMRDLKMIGEKDAFLYMQKFIKDNWGRRSSEVV